MPKGSSATTWPREDPAHVPTRKSTLPPLSAPVGSGDPGQVPLPGREATASVETRLCQIMAGGAESGMHRPSAEGHRRRKMSPGSLDEGVLGMSFRKAHSHNGLVLQAEGAEGQPDRGTGTQQSPPSHDLRGASQAPGGLHFQDAWRSGLKQTLLLPHAAVSGLAACLLRATMTRRVCALSGRGDGPRRVLLPALHGTDASRECSCVSPGLGDTWPAVVLSALRSWPVAGVR